MRSVSCGSSGQRADLRPLVASFDTVRTHSRRRWAPRGGPRFDVSEGRLWKSLKEAEARSGSQRSDSSRDCAAKQAHRGVGRTQSVSPPPWRTPCGAGYLPRRKTILERDLADPQSPNEEADRGRAVVARNARERLATRRAEHGVARNDVAGRRSLDALRSGGRSRGDNGQQHDAVARRISLNQQRNAAVERELGDPAELDKPDPSAGGRSSVRCGTRTAAQAARTEAIRGPRPEGRSSGSWMRRSSSWKPCRDGALCRCAGRLEGRPQPNAGACPA